MRPPTRLLVAARTMLDLKQADIAAAVGLSTRTVFGVEGANAKIESVEAVVAYYEKQGFTFEPPHGGRGWAISFRGLTENYDDERRRNQRARGVRED